MIPETAQRKLAALVQTAEDARALAHSAKDRREVCLTKVQQLHNAFAPEPDIERALEQYDRALDLQQTRYRAWQTAEQLVARLRSWLNELPQMLQLEAVPVPLMAMNGAPSHVVGTLRSEIAKLAAQHHAIRTAPAPLDDAKRQVRELVARLGTKGRPNLTTQGGQLQVHGWSPDHVTGPVPFPIVIETLCWYDPDTMIARLDEVLEAMPSKVPNENFALPLSERPSKLSEIEDEIAILEHREEHLICAAARDGVTIPRRDTASPASILGVRIVSAATARAA